MPGQKISTLSAVNSLQENDQFIIAREGSTYKITGDKIVSSEQLNNTIRGINTLYLETYDDNTDAINHGLQPNNLYKTANGEIRIVFF